MYSHGDPVNLSDPNGHCLDACISVAVVGILGTVTGIGLGVQYGDEIADALADLGKAVSNAVSAMMGDEEDPTPEPTIESVFGDPAPTPELRDVEIKDLNPLHSPEIVEKNREKLKDLSDEELLDSARNPKEGDRLTEDAETGNLVDGNTRAHELIDRARDPNSSIRDTDKVPVATHERDLSDFPDLGERDHDERNDD
jgi:hypothetical protein